MIASLKSTYGMSVCLQSGVLMSNYLCLWWNRSLTPVSLHYTFGWNLMCLWISVSVCLWFCDTTVLQFEGYPYASGCTKSLSWIDSGGKGSVKILLVIASFFFNVQLAHFFQKLLTLVWSHCWCCCDWCFSFALLFF